MKSGNWSNKGHMSPIKVLHIVGCLALLVVMAGFAWKYHPIRQAWKVHAERQAAAQRAERAARGHQPGRFSGGQLASGLSTRLRVFWPLVWPDLAIGSGVWCLFAFGSFALMKRVEVYLSMHGSGDVAAIRALGIDRQALGANKGRLGGDL